MAKMKDKDAGRTSVFVPLGPKVSMPCARWVVEANRGCAILTGRASKSKILVSVPLDELRRAMKYRELTLLRMFM
jgi:hypothetical protein